MGSDPVTVGGDHGRSQLFEAVVAATTDAVVVTSPDGLVVEWNPAAEGVYGYPRHEALGQHVQVLYESQTVALFSSLVARATLSGDAPFEKTVVRRDGSVIEVAGTISAVRDDAGNVVALVGVSRDVTRPDRFA